MKKILVILMMIFTQTPTLGYKVVQRQIPPMYTTPNSYLNTPFGYRSYNYPYYNNYPFTYRSYSPITRIKRYFIGTPTGYTVTPNYNINSNTQNNRNIFEDSSGNEYYYDNGGYYRQNREINGSGSVTIIND